MGHKSLNILSIVNEFTLQKELHNFLTNNVYLDKVKKQLQKKSNIKTLDTAKN